MAMKINTEIIKALNPCKGRFNNYLKHYPDFDGDLKGFLSLDNITYSDKVWVFTRLATHRQNVIWSILCASKVLSIFEEKYPDDKRPRLALDAAEEWVKNPCKETAYAAANAANDAANAANAANDAAAYAAAYAASNAAYAATNAATDAAEEELNLMMMVEAVSWI